MKPQIPPAIDTETNEIGKSLLEIQNLIFFTSRNAIPPVGIPPEEFSKLLERLENAKQLIKEGKLTGSAAVEFQQDYRKLAGAFKPVTIQSVRDTTASENGWPKKWGFRGRTISKAAATIRRFSICSITALLLLLYAQIIWARGTSIITRITEVEARMLQIAGSPTPKDPGSGSLPAFTQSDGDVPTIPSGQTTPPAPSAPGVKTQNAGGLEDKASSNALDKNFTDKIRLEYEAGALMKLLGNWSSWTPGGGTIQKQIEDKNISQKESIKTLTLCKTHAIILLDIYQAYILPLLYGLLGSCCYLLRLLIGEVRLKIYSSDTEMSNWARLYLGILAGLAIGWFLRPDSMVSGLPVSKESLRSLYSITPLTLSFLAGYSVELLFSAMDRLVKAFGSTSQQAPS